MRLRGLEDSLHVLNRIVFLKTFANKRPRETFLTQDVVLRIDEYNCSVFPINIHSYLLFEFSVVETGLTTGPIFLKTDQSASLCCLRNPSIRLAISSPWVSSAK